jgi:tetratricopeptide (TPR) repeat protein
MWCISISRNILCLTMLWVLFWRLPAFSQNVQTLPLAEENYQKGLVSYNQEKWTEAEQYLLKSNEAEPKPMKDFFLSSVYLELAKFDKAFAYAQRALKGHPPLEEPYKTAAQEMKNRAKSSLPGGISTRIAGISENLNGPGDSDKPEMKAKKKVSGSTAIGKSGKGRQEIKEGDRVNLSGIVLQIEPVTDRIILDAEKIITYKSITGQILTGKLVYCIHFARRDDIYYIQNELNINKGDKLSLNVIAERIISNNPGDYTIIPAGGPNTIPDEFNFVSIDKFFENSLLAQKDNLRNGQSKAKRR